MNNRLENRSPSRFQVLEYILASQTETGCMARSLMVDLSLRGCQIRSREKFQTGDMVMLHIPRSGQDSMELHTQVTYCYKMSEDDIYCTGFSFKPAQRSEQIQIAHYLYDRVISKDGFYNFED